MKHLPEEQQQQRFQQGRRGQRQQEQQRRLERNAWSQLKVLLLSFVTWR